MQMRFWLLVLPVLIGGCGGDVSEVTPRSYVGLMMGQTSPIRDRISQELAARSTISLAGALSKSLKPSEGDVEIDFGWITAGGTIVVYSKKYDVVIVEEPSVNDKGITWNCVVHPQRAAPNICSSN